MKITHISTAHPRDDTRIFRKMCLSSVSAGHDVTLIVADGLGDANVDGVKVFDVGKPQSRIHRIVTSAIKAAHKSRILDSDICQLHDPELIPFIIFLSSKTKIIFDFHEDVRQQIYRKTYIPKPLRGVISFAYGLIETFFMRFFSGVICATPTIENIYKARNYTQVIRNYPLLDEFARFQVNVDSDQQDISLVYIGGITHGRGASQLIDALKNFDENVTLHLCGPIRPSTFQAHLQKKRGWSKVRYHGNVNRQTIIGILQNADIGYVTLLPDPSYEEALPVKMFEYFASSTAVIASNFPLWASIINENRSGLLVDPTDVSDIVSTTQLLINDRSLRLNLAQNGRKSFLERYHWEREYQALDKFYKDFL
ncbi:glycosyltransferase family 4 protein [Nereida ignava]|uniref:glycosyltransferase family 4 protein n=1 Tax=Nereida ignava TaxID=282199 RepID=UPI002FE3FFD8